MTLHGLPVLLSHALTKPKTQVYNDFPFDTLFDFQRERDIMMDGKITLKTIVTIEIFNILRFQNRCTSLNWMANNRPGSTGLKCPILLKGSPSLSAIGREFPAGTAHL